MRLRLPMIILFVLLTCAARAKGDEAFDPVYDKIWKELAHTNWALAISSADSLYRSSKLPDHRIRSLILMARLHQEKENLEKSVSYTKMAGKIAEEENSYTWQVRVNSYLAGIYRMMELYSISQEYAEKALNMLPNIPDKDQANSSRALLYQEIAFSYQDREQYRQSIAYFDRAGKCIETFTHNKQFNVMNNERLLADNYRLLGSYDTAIIHYRKAITLTKGIPVHYTIGLLHKGMAEILLNKGDLKNAKVYLDQAEQIADASQNLQLKEAVYALTKDYYTQLNDPDQLAEAREKKDSATGEILEQKADFLSKSYKEFEASKVTVANSGTQKTIMLVALSVLLLSGLIYFIGYRRRKQLELSRFRAIIEQVRKQDEPEPVIASDALAIAEPAPEVPQNVNMELREPVAEDRKRIMPEETEHKLLIKLREFEQSGLFLEKGFSFTDLASWMQTNNKYLSFLLNDHKQVDFNNYINQLRIDYITKLLVSQVEWQQYKIAALADEAGFSSHSQFTAVFKNLMGITPSAFISHLRTGVE